MKTILSEEAVCKWLGIKEWRLADLRNDSKLPYYAVTREFRLYTKQDIEEWVLGQVKLPTGLKNNPGELGG